MEITALIIIGGVWAAFLLPSFFENQRRSSLSSTRSFARHSDLLASVAMQSTEEVRMRRLAQRRRRRSVFLLSFGAVATLSMAVLTGSTLWLGATIVFDIALAGFVTALLQARAAHFRPVAAVVPLAAGTEELSEIEVVPAVRIVAG
jgi:uncharacterized membrane protein